ncbi:MAG TPA: hemolysin family protein [Dehalococcoidia bacterium]|nr:hemolysin family protein [Dehalococcoidia bacterium]
MEPTIPLGSSNLGLSLTLIVVALLGVAFFSSSEISLVALNRIRVRHRAEEGHPGARAAQQIAAQHDKFFATILMSENVLIIFASSLGTTLALAMFPNTEQRGLAVALATILMTVLVLIFGEITPKTLAQKFADVWGLVVARPIRAIMWIETPLTLLFTLVPRGLQRLIRPEHGPASPFVTEAELRLLIDISEQEGTVEQVEGEIADKALRFGDRPVREVMTPRTEVLAVAEATSLRDFLGLYAQESHTRFPIYVENLDQVTGILSIKDVLLSLTSGGLDPERVVTDASRPPVFVPETKRIGELLVEMQRSRSQMVIVVDEFGGTAGLVTLKRLVEEVIGPWGDELAPAPASEPIGIDSFEVAGGLHVSRAREELGLELPDGPYETVAGYLLHRFGHIPEQGEQVRFGPWLLHVTQMQGLRIERVRASRVPQD